MITNLKEYENISKQNTTITLTTSKTLHLSSVVTITHSISRRTYKNSFTPRDM